MVWFAGLAKAPLAFRYRRLITTRPNLRLCMWMMMKMKGCRLMLGYLLDKRLSFSAPPQICYGSASDLLRIRLRSASHKYVPWPSVVLTHPPTHSPAYRRHRRLCPPPRRSPRSPCSHHPMGTMLCRRPLQARVPVPSPTPPPKGDQQ